MTDHPIDLDRFEAVLFDLDGVLTTTARLHAGCWQRSFDAFLDEWDAEHGTDVPRFTLPEDYTRHVDGKPRLEGVRDFLASREIDLPEGAEDAPADEHSVHGVGNRKQRCVEEALRTEGVEAFPGSVAWVREVRNRGLRTAVVSSSRNCSEVLAAAGIDDLFDAQVDGLVAAELGLPGKPAPDTFLEGARRVGVDPEQAIVVEDALAGVSAGRAGGFGLTIGVDRADHAGALAEHGADLVVDDLCELVTDQTEPEQVAGPKAHRLRAAALRLLAADDGYPVDEMRLVERAYNPDYTPQTESLFAVANGYLGLRGTHEEGRPVHQAGTLLNGFYDTWPIRYPEGAYGFAKTGQTIVDVADGTVVKLYVDDEPFLLEQADILDYERALCMTTGTLTRDVTWRSADGRRFTVHSRRFASLRHRHLACVEYTVTALDGPASLTIASELVTPGDDELQDEVGPTGPEDPRRSRVLEGVLEPLTARAEDERVVMAMQAHASRRRMACGMDHHLEWTGPVSPTATSDGLSGRVVYRIDVAAGEQVRLVKWIAYHHGADDSAAELCFRVDETLDRGRGEGLDVLRAAQQDRVREFWDCADVRAEGAPILQQAVHFSLFQLLQASARVEGHGIAAKGLTGDGYDGHYFWDTEIYVMPFLTYTAPEIARSLLRHRYDMLDHARQRAREVGQRGALFPWRTISGEEASAYWAASTAQYHIDADIAHAVVQYVRTTGDDDFMARFGAEMLVETARLWADLGHYSDRHDGGFVIQGVTGPDEYTALVDNNAYTNLMARENLREATRAVRRLEEADPAAHRRLVERTDLDPAEPEAWSRAAGAMYVPYDERAQVHLQDDGFLDLAVWDFEGTPPEKYPLLLHYHPLVLYRHQVIKQADVVLAAFLLGDEFSVAEKRRIFEYYDPLTTGDSSLSESIQSIVAAQVGELRAAEEYFVDAAAVDLADTNGNLRDGIHVASAGGTWLALVYGFGGLRDRDEVLAFDPVLPERMTRLAFRLQVRGCHLEVDIGDGTATYRLLEGPGLALRHADELVELEGDAPVVRPLSGVAPLADAPSAGLH